MVGMDQVVCQECAEILFIDVSMVCGRLVLRFRSGEPVGKLEITLITGNSTEIIKNEQTVVNHRMINTRIDPQSGYASRICTILLSYPLTA